MNYRNFVDDIQAYEKKLNESEKKEKVTLDRLDDLEHNSILIRQLIQKLREEELGMTVEIDTAKNAIANLEGQLQFLKSHYANYVRSVYKNGRVYDVELLFSSKSINQLSIRIQYLKKFSEQRAKDLQGISENKTILEQKNEQLQIKLQSERQLLSEKTREEENLKRTFSQRQMVLKKIRKNKQTYQKELIRKTEASKKIENLIAELIEKERIRKEREEAERRERLAAEARERELNKTAAPPTPQPVDTKADIGIRTAARKTPLASCAWNNSNSFRESNSSGFENNYTKHWYRYRNTIWFRCLCRCRW